MVQEKKDAGYETLPIPWKLNSQRAPCENGEVVAGVWPCILNVFIL